MKQVRTYTTLAVIAFVVGYARGYFRGRLWMLEHLANMSRTH